MTYTISIFRELRTQFPCWADLEAWLESPEGGQLAIIKNGKDGYANYAIIRYEKGVSNMNLPHVRWFRSVVWDTLTNSPVCVAPPKASVTQCHMLPEYVYQDYMEGTMINLFRVNDAIYMVSRSTFGATGTFYSPRPFNELFEDACAVMGRNMHDLIPEGATFVSLLLQHPEHRIVTPVYIPHLVQIHSGVIENDGRVSITENTPIQPSAILQRMPSEDIHAWICRLITERGWSWQGVVIKDGQGNRWRIRSPTYQMIRSLRGNTPNIDGRFVQIYKSNLIHTYLNYYPEEKPVFEQCYIRLQLSIKTLYDRYVRFHITKTLTKDEIELMWRPHIFSLHGMYLYTLREKGQFIREKDVANYVTGLPLHQMLFIMNRREVAPAYQTA
jgi:hypothetical protein